MKIKVWDLPTRIFHWLLALSYLGVFYTSRNERLLEYHIYFGSLALWLTVYRIFMGFVGSQYVRFSQFVKGWLAVKTDLLQMMRLKPDRFLGHNPAVGWAVLVMLFITILMAASGVIVYSGEENLGMWAGLFTFNTAVYARAVHEFFAVAAVAVIVVHICAALFHDFILKENIILTMITGTVEDDATWRNRVAHTGEQHRGRSLARMLLLMLITIAGGVSLIYLPSAGGSDLTLIKQPKVLDAKGFAHTIKANAQWKDECATSCHDAFHPTLLPAASWESIMNNLNKHFGENIELPEVTRRAIANFLVESSAERSTSEASRKILHSLAPGSVPIRITETPYWVDKHSDLSDEEYRRPSIMSKANCTACHPGAELGSFEDRDIDVPDE